MERTVRTYRSDRDLKRCGRFDGDSFCSQWYRGLRPGMEWMRLSLDVGTDVRVQVFSCDSPDKDGDAPAMERDGSDLLLYGVYGQFLRFTVAPGTALSGFELSFPGLSIDAGLPAAMQGDGTLRRLLGVYQTLYMDTDRALAAFPERLDPMAENAVPGLADWVGAACWCQKDEDTVRKLIAAAPRLNRMRGTPLGLGSLLRLITGRDCRLVEPFHWQDQKLSADEREACAGLYGRDAVGAAVLLPAGIPDNALRALKNVIEDFMPLGVDWTLLTLNDDAPIGGNCYMDINACLAEPPSALMDEAELGTLLLD